jgi:hypothetical protein
MVNATHPEAEFENELSLFDHNIDEAVQCFYIWRTFNSAARRSPKIYDLLNRNAHFWVVATDSIRANSLIALGRIFDRRTDSHGVESLLRLAAKNTVIFSKAVLRKRKEKTWRVPVT